jgi:hypothetical protein
MTDYVKIKPLHLIAEDERGATYDYGLPGRENFVFITRKAGAVSGNTYHEGKSKMTNPKTFVLLTGSLEFSYRHIDEMTHQVVVVDQPSIIEVVPRVTHAVKAITDIAILECNSLQDIVNDRHRELVVA